MEKEINVKWKIREAAIQKVLELLPHLVEATRNEPGNISYNIYQSQDDAGVLVLHELYKDEDALNSHKASHHYQDIVVAGIIPHLDSREVISVKKLY